MGNHIQSITSFNDFRDYLPQCQHGGKIGLCEVCKQEAASAITSMNEWELKENEKWEKENLRQENERLNRPEQFMDGYIPKKFLYRSLDNFVGSDSIKNLCMEYVGGFKRKTICSQGRPLVDAGLIGYPGSILFTGKTGCGKTHLAIAIIRELVRRALVYAPTFITAPELLLEIRNTFNKPIKTHDSYDGQVEPKTESDIIDRYSKCEILVLDDLGSEKVSDFTIQSLYLVIDRRNRELMPTIVTTNLSLEEIETQIDARMASRLADMKVVKLTMPDYRKKR